MNRKLESYLKIKYTGNEPANSKIVKHFLSGKCLSRYTCAMLYHAYCLPQIVFMLNKKFKMGIEPELIKPKGKSLHYAVYQIPKKKRHDKR